MMGPGGGAGGVRSMAEAMKARESGVFGVLAEFGMQAPILMETEGPDSTYEAASERAKRALSHGAIRACVVRLVFEDGNASVFREMERMQTK